MFFEPIADLLESRDPKMNIGVEYKAQNQDAPTAHVHFSTPAATG